MSRVRPRKFNVNSKLLSTNWHFSPFSSSFARPLDLFTGTAGAFARNVSLVQLCLDESSLPLRARAPAVPVKSLSGQSPGDIQAVYLHQHSAVVVLR